MNPADRALEDLFQEVGPERAPSHLHARILAQLADKAEIRTVPAPLLARWQWILIGLAAMGSILLAVMLPGNGSSTGWIALLMDHLPDMTSISSTLRTTLIGGAVISGILYVLDAQLNTRVRPTHG